LQREELLKSPCRKGDLGGFFLDICKSRKLAINSQSEGFKLPSLKGRRGIINKKPNQTKLGKS
jgi:hypothetical protein